VVKRFDSFETRPICKPNRIQLVFVFLHSVVVTLNWFCKTVLRDGFARKNDRVAEFDVCISICIVVINCD